MKTIESGDFIEISEILKSEELIYYYTYYKVK